MKTASGKVRSENKWPLPVVVRPRGVREILWTLAVFIAPMVSFEMAGGAYVFLNLACVAYLLRPSKRALIKVMGYCFTICLLWSAFRGGFSEYLQQLLDAIRWSRGSDDSFWGYLLRIFVVAPYSVLTLITFSAYDSRWVDRKKVDDRVWRRQLLRRRQILRAWHRDHNLDEVHR